MKTALVKTEYQGIPVSFTDEGWFNATAVAKRFGKRVDHWLQNAETREYIAALAAAITTRDSGEFIRTREGRNGGTWLHPKLAVAFARWLDVRFAVWCDLQIDRILRHEPVDGSDADSELSTVFDREPLLTAAASIVVRHHLPFHVVYQTLNHFAGAARFKLMTKQQVREVKQFVTRFLLGTDTRQDWKRIESNRKIRSGELVQPELAGFVVPPL